eukprot:3132784-Pyramimonas_sp.AAC.1
MAAPARQGSAGASIWRSSAWAWGGRARRAKSGMTQARDDDAFSEKIRDGSSPKLSSLGTHLT